MNRKSKMLGRRVHGVDGVRPEWRSISAEAGKSRTVSFYVPRGHVLLWNAFTHYLTQQRGESVNRGILRAITFLIQNLDYEEQRKFQLAIRQVVDSDVAEAKEIRQFLKEVMGSDEDIDQILTDRAAGTLVRRQRLIRDSLVWFGIWDKYKEEFNLVDPDTEEHSEVIL